MVLGPGSRLRPVASAGRVAGDSGVLRQAVPRETVKLGLPRWWVPPGTSAPLCLCLLEASTSPTVDPVHLHDSDGHHKGGQGKQDGRDQHNHSSPNTGPKEANSCQPTTCAPAREANGLNDSQHKLGSKDEEECHEVKGAVGSEGLVCRPEPAHITAGSEENQPEQGQAKIGTSSARNPPGQAGHQVHTQSGTVNWCSTGISSEKSW